MVHASHIVSNPRALSPRDKNVSAPGRKTRKTGAAKLPPKDVFKTQRPQRGRTATQRHLNAETQRRKGRKGQKALVGTFLSVENALVLAARIYAECDEA